MLKRSISMKSKYKKYFKWNMHHKYNFEIRYNNEKYVFMYCKKTVKDFDKKAKRIYSHKLIDLIKQASRALRW